MYLITLSKKKNTSLVLKMLLAQFHWSKLEVLILRLKNVLTFLEC